MARPSFNAVMLFVFFVIAWGVLITALMFMGSNAAGAPHTFEMNGKAGQLQHMQGGPCWSEGDDIRIAFTIDLDDEYRTWPDQRRNAETSVYINDARYDALFTFPRSLTLPPQPDWDDVGYVRYDLGDNTNARFEFNNGLYGGKMIWSTPSYGQYCESFIEFDWTPTAPIIGDANYDGAFDSSDLIQVMQAGKYDTGFDAGWSQGDWSGDNRFNSNDIVRAFQAGTYDSVGVAAVPEPSPEVLIALATLMCVAIWRRP